MVSKLSCDKLKKESIDAQARLKFGLLMRLVETRPGHNIGLKKAPKLYFNESESRLYETIYETLQDHTKLGQLGLVLVTLMTLFDFWSHLEYLVETFLTFGFRLHIGRPSLVSLETPYGGLTTKMPLPSGN